MVFKNIIGAINATLLIISFNANAVLVGFEFSGLTKESTLNVPWGSFAGGRIIYDTQSLEDTINYTYTGNHKGYLFNAPPIEFTFEIYKNSNKDIRYALTAGQVENSSSDFEVRVYNNSGGTQLDSLNYTGYNAMSLMNVNGQPALTEFRLSLGGLSALTTSALPDYVPDLSVFTNSEPQIAAWAVDASGHKRHLFSVRDLTFNSIDPSELSAVPIPGSLLLMLSGMIALIRLQGKKLAVSNQPKTFIRTIMR